MNKAFEVAREQSVSARVVDRSGKDWRAASVFAVTLVSRLIVRQYVDMTVVGGGSHTLEK